MFRPSGNSVKASVTYGPQLGGRGGVMQIQPAPLQFNWRWPQHPYPEHHVASGEEISQVTFTFRYQ